MAWGVDFTKEAEAWLENLEAPDRARMMRQVDKLKIGGPTLGRPTVDTIQGPRHHNMKELRVQRSPLRALFAFGPDRRALILVGGKKGAKRWYDDQIRVADQLLDKHLDTFARRSACRDTRARSRSAGRSA